MVEGTIRGVNERKTHLRGSLSEAGDESWISSERAVSKAYRNLIGKQNRLVLKLSCVEY
jgi:hypothetical protein